MAMRKLTDDEKAYLKIAYKKGYRYIATDKDNRTFFHESKPIKESYYWRTFEDDCFRSLVNFGTFWEDEEPIEILDLLTSNKCKLKKFITLLFQTLKKGEWQ